MDKQKLIKKQKPLLFCIIFLAIIVNLGFFPIINFNPENPVNLGLFKLVIILMAGSACVYIGTFEAIFFPKWSILSIFPLMLQCPYAACAVDTRSNLAKYQHL